MKIPLLLGVIGPFALLVGTLMAQDRPTKGEAIKPEVAADIRQAANRAGVESSERLVVDFADSVSSQTEALTQVYSTIPRELRVARLARYLSAKAAVMSSPPSGRITADDLADFHWGYIARDIQFSPVRLDSPKPARLLNVESTGGRYTFVVKTPAGFKPGSVILLPVSADHREANLTLTFGIGNANSLWTGTPAYGSMQVATAGTSKGCEIILNSTPNKASIYFNGRKWYALTNTAVVHDPGTWEVILRLEGRKEWRAQNRLLAGESWTIDAVLENQ